MKLFAHMWPALKVHPKFHFYKERGWESFGFYGTLPLVRKCVSIGVRLW